MVGLCCNLWQLVWKKLDCLVYIVDVAIALCPGCGPEAGDGAAHTSTAGASCLRQQVSTQTQWVLGVAFDIWNETALFFSCLLCWFSSSASCSSCQSILFFRVFSTDFLLQLLVLPVNRYCSFLPSTSDSTVSALQWRKQRFSATAASRVPTEQSNDSTVVSTSEAVLVV